LRQGRLPPGEQSTLEQRVPRGYVEFARHCYPRFADAAREVATESHASYENTCDSFDNLPDEVFLPGDTVHLNRLGNELVARRLLIGITRLLD
jgi:hypothetical protein